MELNVHGRSVFAATGGKPFDPALPAILFLHGSGMDRTVWNLQTRWFAWHGRGVLAVDLPGHGRSQGPALTSVEALADWAAAAIAAAGARQAAIVGHSLGALVALDAAARHPESVRAIALCGVSASMAVHPELLAAGVAGEHRAFELIVDWGVGRHAHLGGSDAPGGWIPGGAMRLLERGAKGVVGIDLAACNEYKHAIARAAKVRCPALFVLGEGDRMSPAKAAEPLIKAIAGARVEIVRRAGHMMQTEQPGATLDALKTLL
jgi:pimeloyl-ACP methyl ester carboxylesterase